MTCSALGAALLLGVAAAAASAETFRAVERKDWVAPWDRVVAKVLTTPSGGAQMYWGPAPGARREIMLRANYEKQPPNRRLQTAIEASAGAKDVLGAAAVRLAPLQVVEFSIDDDAVRSLEVAGEAVLIFWTTPFVVHRVAGGERLSSRLYLEGRRRGHAILRATRADGGMQVLSIDVR